MGDRGAQGAPTGTDRVPTLKMRVPVEVLAGFDEAKGGMAKYLKKRQTSPQAVAVLLFVYDTVRREGRLAEVLARYQSPPGLEFR